MEPSDGNEVADAGGADDPDRGRGDVRRVVPRLPRSSTSAWGTYAVPDRDAARRSTASSWRRRSRSRSSRSVQAAAPRVARVHLGAGAPRARLCSPASWPSAGCVTDTGEKRHRPLARGARRDRARGRRRDRCSASATPARSADAHDMRDQALARRTIVILGARRRDARSARSSRFYTGVLIGPVGRSRSLVGQRWTAALFLDRDRCVVLLRRCSWPLRSALRPSADRRRMLAPIVLGLTWDQVHLALAFQAALLMLGVPRPGAEPGVGASVRHRVLVMLAVGDRAVVRSRRGSTARTSPPARPAGAAPADARHCASYSAATTSAISSPAAVGLVATRTPASSSTSIFACAVPFEPEMIAPAWPIFLPGGAVTPAM